MKKKTISDWYGPGVLSGRDGYPYPHKTSNVGSEGPKRLVGTPKRPVKSTKKAIEKPTKLKDKYGRVISREEFNKREKYRAEKRSVPSGVRPDTTKADKAETKRRKEYRKNAPSEEYRKITKNKNLPTGISSRQVNAAAKRVAKKTPGTADAKARAAESTRTKLSTGYVTRYAESKATAAAKKTTGSADAKARAASAARLAALAKKKAK